MKNISQTVIKLTQLRMAVKTRTGRYAVYIGLFGLIGVIALAASHAGTQSSNQEAENGTLGSCTAQVSDTTASSGLAVALRCRTRTMPYQMVRFLWRRAVMILTLVLRLRR